MQYRLTGSGCWLVEGKGGDHSILMGGRTSPYRRGMRARGSSRLPLPVSSDVVPHSIQHRSAFLPGRSAFLPDVPPPHGVVPRSLAARSGVPEDRSRVLRVSFRRPQGSFRVLRGSFRSLSPVVPPSSRSRSAVPRGSLPPSTGGRSGVLRGSFRSPQGVVTRLLSSSVFRRPLRQPQGVVPGWSGGCTVFFRESFRLLLA